MKLKKIGADVILTGIALPWVAWVVISIFNMQKAQAVQETKYDNIIEILREIKGDVKELKIK